MNQEGCPDPACDGSHDLWCIVSNPGCAQEETEYGGEWMFCTPTPPSPTPAPPTPAPPTPAPPTWVPTCGGTAGGAMCALPFTYEGVEYSECTYYGHNRPWCLVNSANGDWGNC